MLSEDGVTKKNLKCEPRILSVNSFESGPRVGRVYMPTSVMDTISAKIGDDILYVEDKDGNIVIANEKEISNKLMCRDIDISKDFVRIIDLVKISSPGQITVPSEIVDMLSLKEGHKVAYIRDENCHIIMINASLIAKY